MVLPLLSKIQNKRINDLTVKHIAENFSATFIDSSKTHTIKATFLHCQDDVCPALMF